MTVKISEEISVIVTTIDIKVGKLIAYKNAYKDEDPYKIGLVHSVIKDNFHGHTPNHDVDSVVPDILNAVNFYDVRWDSRYNDFCCTEFGGYSIIGAQYCRRIIASNNKSLCEKFDLLFNDCEEECDFR